MVTYTLLKNQIDHFVEQLEARRMAYMKSDFHNISVELESVYY